MFILSYSEHLKTSNYSHLQIGQVLTNLWTDHGDLGYQFALWCLNHTLWDGESSIEIGY